MIDDDGPTGLVWRDERTPVSARFGDVYFSVEGGLEEARHVFLAGCDLPADWHRHFARPDRPASYIIGETGFGTGLNFLAVCALWCEQAKTLPPDVWLDFGSVELFPLARGDLARALGCWPELAPFAAALLAAWPVPVPGFHRIILPQYRVRLTLMIGDAATMLQQWSIGAGQAVQAWFLDGFSPARNPDMWQPAVFAALARLSHPGTKLSSFTAARMVRDGLAAVGFVVEKARGFGRKRDMIRAVFDGPSSRAIFDGPSSRAIIASPSSRAGGLAPVRRVAIIGGGIAGAALAWSFGQRGCAVTVYDRLAAPAGAASGNPVGMVMPKLQLGTARAARFHRAAFRLTRHVLAGVSVGPVGGVLQLAPNDAPDDVAVARMARLVAEPFISPDDAVFVDADAAADCAGIAVHRPGLWLPMAGWVRPPDLVRFLMRGAVWQGGWIGDHAAIDALRESFDHVILATGMDHDLHPALRHLPLRPRKGQITLMGPVPQWAALRCCLTAGRYLAPLVDGGHVLGATCDAHDMHLPIVSDAEADHQNLGHIAEMLPHLKPHTDAIIGHRVAVRATTPDHLPIIGRLGPGLSVLTGLGSSGLTTGLLAAELLATELTGGVMPVEADIVAGLNAARYAPIDGVQGSLPCPPEA